MAVSTGLAIAGGLANALGSKKQADATKAAANAARYNPYGTSGAAGTSSIQGNNIDLSFGSNSQSLFNNLWNTSNAAFGGTGPNASLAALLQNQGGGALPGLFTNAINTQDPSAAGYQANIDPIMAQLTGAGQYALGQAGPQNAALQSGLFNQFSGLQNAALNSIQGAPQVGGYNPYAADLSGAGGLFQQSANLAGQAAFDPTNMVNDRLSLLRQQAAPQEEQAFNSLQNRLFSQGRLGSTGGSRDIEAFARGLGSVDLQRQVEAQNLGLGAQQQSAGILAQQAGLFQGLGSQVGGQALQNAGLLANQGISARGQNINQRGQDLSQQGLFANTALGFANPQLSAGVNLGGQDISRLSAALGAGQGLFGQAGQLAGQGFAAGFDVNNAVNQRAMQRLAAAQGLFGFGQDINTQNFNQGLSALQAQQSLSSDLRAQAGLGLQAGGQAAQAGGNVGQILLQGGSPAGSFLSSFGSGLFGQAMNGGFGGSKPQGSIYLPGTTSNNGGLF